MKDSKSSTKSNSVKIIPFPLSFTPSPSLEELAKEQSKLISDIETTVSELTKILHDPNFDAKAVFNSETVPPSFLTSLQTALQACDESLELHRMCLASFRSQMDFKSSK